MISKHNISINLSDFEFLVNMAQSVMDAGMGSQASGAVLTVWLDKVQRMKKSIDPFKSWEHENVLKDLEQIEKTLMRYQDRKN